MICGYLRTGNKIKLDMFELEIDSNILFLSESPRRSREAKFKANNKKLSTDPIAIQPEFALRT